MGALGPTIPWALQTWSLTNPCGVVGNGDGTELKSGVYATARQGGEGIAYLLSQESGVPPSPKMAHSATFPLVHPGTIGDAVVVGNLAGNGHAYAAWSQTFPDSAGGIYVKDLTSNGPTMKAPGSGIASTNVWPPVASNLALASTNTHGGVYLAYCANTTTSCNMLLWRVGAAKAIKTPGATLGQSIVGFKEAPALSAGPDGRLWLAWYSIDKAGTMFLDVARTNEADTAFGPVETYSTRCWGYPPLIGLGGGRWDRLDVAMQCVVNRPEDRAGGICHANAGATVGPPRGAELRKQQGADGDLHGHRRGRPGARCHGVHSWQGHLSHYRAGGDGDAGSAKGYGTRALRRHDHRPELPARPCPCDRHDAQVKPARSSGT